MKDIIVLEWSYTPPDYFEQPLHIVRDRYEIIIDSGKVEARINPEYYDKDHNLREELHDALIDRFLGVQILSHKPFELSKSSMYRLHPNGGRDVTLFPEPIVVRVSVGPADILVKDKNGNILSDTRRERIEKKAELADLAEKHRSANPVLEAMLKSYNASVNDPNNELVHLYEIRETLSKKFGGETVTREALGISRNEWSRLGQLANKEPLKQGRHRGKDVGQLRDATEGELKEARTIARALIEAYLKYLDRQSQ